MEKAITEEPARLKHNRELADKYYAANNDPKRYPWVGEQIPTLALEEALYPFGYNPTIIGRGMKRCCSAIVTTPTRFQPNSRWPRSWKVAKRSRNGAQILPGRSVEDPKFFTVAGKLHLSWVETKWPDTVKEAWLSIRNSRMRRSSSQSS